MCYGVKYNLIEYQTFLENLHFPIRIYFIVSYAARKNYSYIFNLLKLHANL